MNITLIAAANGPQNWTSSNLASGLGGSEAMLAFYAMELAKEYSVEVLVPGTYGTRFLDNVIWHSVDMSDFRTWPEPDGDVAIALRDPMMLEWAREGTFRVRALLANDQRCPSLPPAVEYDYCNLVITISRHQTKMYQEMYDITPGLYLTSSAGVNVKDFQSGSHDWDHCIYASTPERGLAHFSTLWPMILQQRKDANLTVTSGFQLYGWDDRKAAQFGGGFYQAIRNLHHVYYPGHPYSRAEYCGLMQCSGLMLYPSTYDEQCCISALEAAAAGLPIITTNRAALAERVIDGVTGYLIDGEPGTPEYDEMFVEKAAELLFDHEKAAEMGRLGREMAKAFDYEVLAKEWVKRFKEIL